VFFHPFLIDTSMNFKEFLEKADSTEADVKESLGKLPKKHAALVKGYKFKFLSTNTLSDGENIGFIDEEKKTITIASPWNYGREFTFLHEVGHAVWKYIVDRKKKKEWIEIVKRTKEKQDQNDEELFCMAYANEYANHQDVIHDHPEWSKFIKSLPQ